MRRRRRPRAALLAVLIPLALVLGIWLGGHPDTLPGFARDALVADTDGRLYEEAVDTIERDYYRKVDRDALLTRRWRPRSSRCRTSSRTTSRPRTTRASSSTPRASSRASACRVTRGQGGPARRRGLRRLAGQGGRAEGRRHHRRRQRQVARGQDLGPVDRADQGPGGLDGDARPQGRAQAHLKRAKVDIPIVQSELEALRRQEDRVGAPRRASPPGSGENVKTGGQQGAQEGRRRASCSTCATTAAGS